METSKALSSFVLICILLISGSAYAIEVFESDCTVEVYASYSQLSTTEIVFDSAGNLYATHDPPGTVWRITPGGAASEFIDNIDHPRGIVWGGGTNFGNYLYIINFETLRGDIFRADLNGTISHFTSLNGKGPAILALDRTGNYKGTLYAATRTDDRIYEIDVDGRESVFSEFPFSRNGGGPTSMAFDTTSNYNGLLYLGTLYNSENSDVSGLFSIDSQGNAARFTDALVQVQCIAFDLKGSFGGYMFVGGKKELDSQDKLWRVDPYGNASEFASTCVDVAFGLDGAMYVTEQSPSDNTITVSRITKNSSNSYYVDSNDGDDLNDGTSSQEAFATIQKAIDTAPEGYTILVKPGTYFGGIDFLGKAITVQGVAGPGGGPVLDVPDNFAVSFISNEGPDSVLKNFIIKNSFMAVFILGSSPTISNVTVVDNVYGINAYLNSNPEISNCIFRNNLNGDLSGCVSKYSLTGETGEGNIYSDPLFFDPNNNDYHLKSERGRYWPEHDVWVLDTVSSPAIDAGDPNDDTANEPAPNGGSINMGAYGGTAYASMSEMPSRLDPDVNKDGIIDESDLADLVNQWLAVSGWSQ